MISSVNSYNASGYKKVNFGSIIPLKFIDRNSGKIVETNQHLIDSFELSLRPNCVDNSLRGYLKKCDVHDFAKEKWDALLGDKGVLFRKLPKTNDWVMLTGKDKIIAEREFTLKNITDYWQNLKKKGHSGRELMVQVVPTNIKTYIPKMISSNKVSPDEFLGKML